MMSFPFIIDELHGGFMKVDGILRMDGEQLLFEFQKKDNVIGMYQSEIQTEVIPIADLSMAEYKKGFFKDKIVLHGKRATSFKALPGKDMGERVLKIKKKNRSKASSLISRINLELSELKLKELEDKE